MAARNPMSQKVFNLDGWNTHHFVGNLIFNSERSPKNNFSSVSIKKVHKTTTNCKKTEKFGEKKIKFFSTFYFSNIKKTGIAPQCA